MTAVVVHADFAGDVRRHCLNLLTQVGSKVPAEQQGDVFRVCVAYYNVAQRFISAAPRRVHKSRQLLARALPDAVRAGVQLIEARSIAGASLELHLSERVLRPLTKDWLLNFWGIHHLHVHEQRGDDLLYVIVRPGDLYFIDVRPHADMPSYDLPETVVANWPGLIKPNEHIRPPPPGTPGPSASEMDQAWRAGVNPYVVLSDGKVYGPSGGGLTTAGGSSARAVDRASFLLRHVAARQEFCERNADGFAKLLGTSELHLRYFPDTGRVVETTTGVHWAAPDTPATPE